MPSTTTLERAFTAELPFLRALARRLAGDADADDLVQDAWVDASHGGVEAAGSWRSYLAAVLRNRARMTVRAATRRRQREEAAEVAGAGAIDPDAASQLAEVLRALADELDALPAIDRSVLQASFMEGRTSAEIGARHGMTAATVRSRIHRSLDRLRTSMDARHGGHRHGWAWAVLPAGGPSLGASTVAIGSGVGVMAKVLMLVGAAGVALAAAWWTWGETRAPEPAPPASAPVAAPQPVPEPESAAAVQPAPARPEADARAAWAAKRSRIHQARRARRTAVPTAPEAPPSATLTAEPDEVAALAGAVPVELAPLFQSLTGQVIESFKDCIELVPEGTKGKITLQADVISEPDIGTIVESVDVVEDSIGAQAIEECITQSIYAFDLSSPLDAVTRRFDFTLDFDERTISAGTPVTLEQLNEMIERNPALLDEHPEIAQALAEAEAQAQAAGEPTP